MIRLRNAGSTLRLYLLALVTLPALLLSASPTDAALISAFTGNTRPQDLGFNGGGVDGTVNFAVFDRTGGTATDPWGTGANLAAAFVPGISEAFNSNPPAPSPSLDLSAQFLYLFQTVNDGTNTNSISQNSVQVAGLPFPTATSATGTLTSYGRFATLGFVDGEGAIQGTGNTFLGSVAAAFGDPSSAVLGVTGVTVSAVIGLEEPDSITLGPSSLRALYAADLPSLVQNVAGTLWGYTSNLAPTFPANTAIIDGGTSADGRVPTAVIPEPGTMVLAFTGLPVLLAVGGWRRRQAQA